MQKLKFFKSPSFKVGLFVALSRILGLARDHLLARYLGSTGQADAFFTAFRIPNMLRDLLGEGALSSVIVARLGLVKQEDGEDRLKKLIRSLFSFWLILMVLISILGVALAPWLVAAIAPGFLDDPDKKDLTVHLTRMMFPYITFVCLAAILMGVLHHKRSFGWASIGSSCSNFVIIFMIYTTIEILQGGGFDVVECFVVAYLAGGLTQLFSLTPGIAANKISLWPTIDFSDPEIKKVLILIGPAIIGVAGVQINVWVNNIYASYLEGDGSIAQISFAFRVMQLPVGVVGVAVSTVLLPTISELTKEENKKVFAQTLSQALISVSFLMVPAVLGLVVLGEELISFLYEFGEFDEKARQGTWNALQGYLPGILAYGLNKNLLQAYYAYGDLKYPVKVSLVSVFINATINYILVFKFGLGAFGLTLGTSTVLILNTLWLLGGLHFRHKCYMLWGPVLKHFSLIVFVAVAMALITWMLKQQIDGLQVMIAVPLFTATGLLSYFALIMILQKCFHIKVKKLKL